MDIANLLQDVRTWFRNFNYQGNDGTDMKAVPELLDMVQQARREWQSAQNYYNAVSDTDLIDHAVYLLQAAEKKYVYLLKQARQEGVVYDPFLTGEGKTEGKLDQ